jgi:glycosyltransferase involved in cell wall biosynthesis
MVPVLAALRRLSWLRPVSASGKGEQREVGRAAPRVVLDGRWLPFGGAGRTTELLLRALALTDSPYRWVLWGPPDLARWPFPGAELLATAADPRTWNGQRQWFDVPDGDLTVYLHQQRPLRRTPSMTLVYDTIPLHFTANPVVRRSKRLFLRRVGTISDRILTLSQYSRSCIEQELGVPAGRISVLGLPADDDLARRVLAVRGQLPRDDVALYVGRFAAHKNLPRLVEAFGRTEFAGAGGRLLLVGGTEAELTDLAGRLSPTQLEAVELRRTCPQEELERLLATCLFVVQPSLEEGFGLPTWEAQTCGVPVCVSDGGSLPETTLGFVQPFPAASVDAMAAALDACAAEAKGLGPADATARSEAFRARAPTLRQFGERFLTAVAAAIG